MATYRDTFGKYEVTDSWGERKWFKSLEKAKSYFDTHADALAEDWEEDDGVIVITLQDLKTGEIIKEEEISD